jgi:guanosine-3',5'-bis(diphosphate) 3'-pyrophosphohydrolase
VPIDRNDWPALEKDAQQFAEERHAAQRYGDQLYTVHLARVRAVLTDFGHGGPLGVAAWLHDMIEDTGTTREEISARFGENVAVLVYAVTGVGKNRAERNASAYMKIQGVPAAAILKLADRIANVEASQDRPDKLQMYRDEWPAFAKALDGLGDPRMWSRLKKALGVADLNLN